MGYTAGINLHGTVIYGSKHTVINKNIYNHIYSVYIQ